MGKETSNLIMPALQDGLATAHLAAIVESAEDAIISKSLDGIIQSWNPAAERTFGYRASEIVGKSILTLIPTDRHHEEDMILSRLRRGDRVEHFETIRRRKDGTLVPISVTVSPIRDASGTVIGASKIARDLSDRIRAEGANARLAAIIESSDDAIVSKNLDGVVQSWNSGAERLFGYLAEEMIGKSITLLLPSDRHDEEQRILERLRRGERIDHFETQRVRKDGRIVHVSVTVSPIKDLSGQIVGASKVARDISERKLFEMTTQALTMELEQRVRERTAELEAAHREMESFTYSIAHDLRGPLRAIGSTSAILAEDYRDRLDDAALELLGRQAASVRRLGLLIDALLQYSRLGKSSLKIEQVDLSALALDLAEDLVREPCTFSAEPGLHAEGDKNLLRLLLQNLIDNACKFSPEGGLVEFGQSGPTYFVRDQGSGFDMAYAEKIFAPFERLVRPDEIPGTGIGLANVKRIIEKHGGTIWANSVVGTGTTFYFTLPKSQ